MVNFANPSMFSSSPDIGGISAEYSSNTAQQYDESLSKELEQTKNVLENEKMQDISQIVYNSVNNEKLTESDYQFSKEESYGDTDFADKTDTYVNMNTSYRYIKFNVDGAGEAYNQLGDWANFQKDSPKKVFSNLKNRFVELGFNKKFENGQRRTVNMDSDKDFLYVIGLFQAVIEDKVDSASKKDFRVWPNTLKSLAGNTRFEVKNTVDDISETKDALNETKSDVIRESILDEQSLEEKINELDNGVVKYGNDIFDLPETSYGNLKKDIENKLIELSVLQETVKWEWDTSQFDKIWKLIDSYNKLLNTIVDLEKNKSVVSLSHEYLWELFKLDDDVEKSVFKKKWKNLEESLPKLDLVDENSGFYSSMYFWLYDLRNKFTDSKVKKEIVLLMEWYDPLFYKYENFYNVWDKIAEQLIDDWLFGDDLEKIEDFFDKEWTRERVDSWSRWDTVSWGLLTEDDEDWTAGQRTKLVSAVKKLISKWKISEQELGDFKAVMFQTREVFSNVLDGLSIKDLKQEKLNVDTDQNDDIDLEAQREFEKSIRWPAKKIQAELQKQDKEIITDNIVEKVDKLWDNLKEFEENKNLFVPKLSAKFNNRKEELKINLDEKNLKLLVAEIKSDIVAIKSVISDYDLKIAENKDMFVALSGQQQAYKDILVKYNSLLSLANQKISNLTIKKTVQSEVKKENVIENSIEQSDKIDLSKELLSERWLSDVEIEDIKASIVTPKYLNRMWNKYNLNKLEDVNAIIESWINTTAFRNIRDNLVYIDGLKK